MERKDTPKDPSGEADEREEQREALRDFERDAGENYETGFGRLVKDSPSVEIDEAEREDR